MAIATVIGLLATQASGAAGAAPPLAASRTQGSDARVSAPVKCSAHKAVKFYAARIEFWRDKMGAVVSRERRRYGHCPRYLAHVLQRKALAWRKRAERYIHYHYAWWVWMPAKWQRIGACETGYGKRPGNWRWNSGTYQGAFGFYHGSWDAFRLPGYPSEAYNATPRQQYEVALAIWRRYGFSGWGCRGA